MQELSGHFENQKVMYGFCSVKDSQAALPKYVLINWVCSCGLGAESLRTVALYSSTHWHLGESPTSPEEITRASGTARLLPFPDPLSFTVCLAGW